MDRNQQAYGNLTEFPATFAIGGQIGLRDEEVFTGTTSTTLRSVVDSTEFAARWSTRPWDDKDRIRFLIAHLGGKARMETVSFCLRAEEMNGKHPSYEEIVEHLTRTFQQTVSPEQMVSQLLQYILKEVTSFDEYAEGFRSRVQEFPTRYHQDIGVTFFCALFKLGLSEEIRGCLKSLPKQPKTWQATVEVIRENPSLVQLMNKPERHRKTPTQRLYN